MKRFPYSVLREDGHFVARSPKIGLTGHGDSVRDAEIDLKEKLERQLHDLGERPRPRAGRKPKRSSAKSGLKSLPRASKKMPF